MYENVLEKHFISNKGLSVQEYFNPVAETPKSLLDMANRIKEIVKQRKTIKIFGDYDVDGITATSILVRGIRSIGGKVTYRIPERLTEGYGISIKAIDEITEDVIITVDNGISCIKAIEKAKSLGKEVLIIDHHEPYVNENGNIEVPNADLILDHKLTKDFKTDYCGAGLSLRVIKLLTSNEKVIKYCTVLASLGTIADVVDVKFDNRNIIVQGLDIMNNQYFDTPYGISALIKSQNLSIVNTHNIGFRITPVINACGRMIVGAVNKAVELCLTDNKDVAYNLAKELIEINELRKSATEKGLDKAKEIIKSECRYGENPLIIHSEDIHEGVSGIVAGRLSEEMDISVGIFSTAETIVNGEKITVYKGSFRSPHIHIKELLDDCNSTIYAYGGHAKAAGCSVKKEEFYKFMSSVEEKDIEKYPVPSNEEDNTVIEVDAENVTTFYNELEKYAPFGEGNKPPLVKVNKMELYPRNGAFFSVMGENEETIKLYGKDFSVVWFKEAKRYEELGKPHNINVTGKIQASYYGKNMEIQIVAENISINETTVNTPTSLASALLARMKMM